MIIGIKTRGSCIENFVETWKRIFVFLHKRINPRIKILRALYFFTKRINVLHMLIREKSVHFLRFSANTINLVLDPFLFCNILYKPVPLFVDSPANRIARRKLQKLRPP